MTQISYKALKDYLDTIENNAPEQGLAPLYLIHGEQWLCRKAFEMILNALLPESQRAMGYDPVDGSNEKIAAAIERVNTFSFFSEAKVVAIHDSQVFDSSQDKDKILEKAKTAWDNNDPKKAATGIAHLLSLLNLTFEDIRGSSGKYLLGLDADTTSPHDQWIDKLIQYCTDNGVRIPAVKDHAAMLEESVKKGFPKKNHLVIVTENTDKRRSLYKTIDQYGIIIDCSVPRGNRRDDKIAQEAVLGEMIQTVLEQHGKTIDKQAAKVLYEMTGFDPHTFSNNLEKLVLYVRDRTGITVDDVHAVVNPSKKSPVFELTNAILDRDLDTSLYLLDSLLRDNMYPLQIFSAIVNQIRKLLIVKAFAESGHGKAWHQSMSYSQFKTRVMPGIKTFDAALVEQWEVWESFLNEDREAENKNTATRRSKKKTKPSADLFVAQNPNNSYPVYQILCRSQHYKMEELAVLMQQLGDADLKFKTTGQNPKIILEKVVFGICSRC